MRLRVLSGSDGYCWNCQQTPATIVTSFNVGGTTVNKVDSLTFGGGNSYSWKRSVSATNQRLYIGGPQYNWTPGSTGGSSIIEVVDISDMGGALKKGGFLTRDPRVVERKKYGRAKARRSFQFSKR